LTEALQGDRHPVLEPVPATAEAFAPYGFLVEARAPKPLAVNLGTAFRHDVAVFATDCRPGSRLVTSAFATQVQELPLPLTMLERHPCSDQVIASMRSGRFVLAVALPDEEGRPRLDSLKAFLFQPGSGVIYRAGVWHHPMVGLDTEGLFFVQSWQDGSAQDCVEVEITPQLLVEPRR
jgi:ureidoglycolate lyase